MSRAVTTCLNVPEIGQVFVSSDCPNILSEAEASGATAILRPSDLSSDTSRSEEAIIHWLNTLEEVPEIVAFVECTSPFISASDISKAIGLVSSKSFDSVFSASRTDVLLWEMEPDESFKPTGHNPYFQTMRQERAPKYVETGAFFVFKTDGFLQFRCRFFGRIGGVEVDPLHSIEIDEPWQLELANAIFKLQKVKSDGQLHVGQ